MNLKRLINTKISPRITFSVVPLVIVSVSLFEWRSLDKLDHPKPYKVGCIGCHSDKKTLEAIADKAGDSLYLVHSGQLTIAQLDKLTGKKNDPAVNSDSAVSKAKKAGNNRDDKNNEQSKLPANWK